MSKKRAKKSDVVKMLVREEEMVNKEVSEFYPDGLCVLANMNSAPGKDPFAQFISTEKKEQSTQIFTEEEMQEKCLQIRDNVKNGKCDNIEMNFIDGVLRFNGKKYEFGSTLIKIRAMNVSEPVFLHIKSGDAVSSLVFIGGTDMQAFLVTKNNENKTSFVRLEELHLLSICENSTPEREIGLMVSYSWITAKVHSSIIMGYNLDPVKNLLLAESLRPKNTEEEKAVKEMGDEENG